MATSSLDREKKELRAWAKRQRAKFLSLDADVRTELLASLSDAFLGLIAEQSWKHIAVFIPLPGEPDIWTPAQHLLAAQSAIIYAPRMMPEHQLDLVKIINPVTLVRGPFGVIEPPTTWPELSDFAILDAVFIPGLAFSSDGGRLGFGGGWYDRMLARLPEKTTKIGVCWDQMLIPAVPMVTGDEYVTYILSDVGLIVAK